MSRRLDAIYRNGNYSVLGFKISLFKPVGPGVETAESRICLSCYPYARGVDKRQDFLKGYSLLYI